MSNDKIYAREEKYDPNFLDPYIRFLYDCPECNAVRGIHAFDQKYRKDHTLYDIPTKFVCPCGKSVVVNPPDAEAEKDILDENIMCGIQLIFLQAQCAGRVEENKWCKK